MVKAYLLLGSNIGNRYENLHTARVEISRLCGQIVTSSGIYETEPWGEPGQPWFYNQVIEIATALPAEELLNRLQQIETAAGRTRERKWGPRILDIDILYYDGKIFRTERLTIPPAELHLRRFALTPLAEIAPLLVTGSGGHTARQLLERCPDRLAVRRIV